MQDGNIHCHIDNLSRRGDDGQLRIAVASAAYVSGLRIWSDVEQRFVDFDMREDVVFSEILLPEGAPDWASDRAALWNRVDLSAKRKDARLAKKVDAAITRDIPAKDRVELLRAFAAPFVALGCAADVAIHEDGTDHNPHIHILLTTRELVEDGFGNKLTALEQRRFVKDARKRWADLSNQFLEKAGSAVRVDHRSYKARGIEAVPTVHRGPDAVERREKREHARRVRQEHQEEQTMAKPTSRERHDYPLLSARETWPPEPEPFPDMTEQERDEHHSYWQDRKLERIEEVQMIEPEPVLDRPWYEQALDRARGEAGLENEEPRRGRREVDQNRDRGRYEEQVLSRARRMDRSQAEVEALAAVSNASPETRKLVEDLILEERMRRVRDVDRDERMKRFPPDVRERLEALRDEEIDRPVPGPDRELLSRAELDRAQQRELEEYEREQRDYLEYKEWDR